MAQESKAQRAERLKLEKNPWACFAELEAFAKRGYDAIPREWLGTYLRWWGVYTQGDGAGVVGGSAGEGKAIPYFMVRIRRPNGLLTSQQLRIIGDLAERYARGVADITVRQNIQLHWVEAEALPELLRELWKAEITTIGACGDVTRNITGCPLAGVDAEEVCDASPLVVAASRELAGNKEFYNLPRKFKISIAGCRVWCSYPEINDIGLTAVARQRNGRSEIGFSLRVGGGLSTSPHLAERLNTFVKWEQVLPVLRGIAELFRDAAVLREHRERARMKFLFTQHGWTAESFQEELEDRIGFKLDPAEAGDSPADIYRDHTGVHAQKQRGLCYVGTSVLRGRLSAQQMRATAALAERFGSTELRTTNMQNLLIVNVLESRADSLARELGLTGLPVEGSSFRRGTIACTGSEFCKLAITETKTFARWLVEELEERLPGFDQHLKLNITGCPNSCGQHWIADLGIEGKKLKANGHFVDAYYFCLGGSVGKFASIARPMGYRCTAAEVPDAIERLLRHYLETHRGGENLRQFFTRHSDDELRAALAGQPVDAVARDPSPGRVPHEVSG